jgi:vitamin B12 transporter
MKCPDCSQSFRTSSSRSLQIAALSALVLAPMLPATPLAGASTAAHPSAAPLSPDTIHLSEIVVTGTRLPTARVLLPQAITILDGADLEARGVIFLLDALREVPGVQVVRTGAAGGTTSVFMRGGNSNFVKVLLDGVPLNEPGGRFDFGTFTLENVERIEVLRGPSSVLYGSDAVSGVVQIFTKAGAGASRVGGAVRAGSHGSWGVEGTALGGSERVSWTTSLGRSEIGGIHEFNSGFESLVGSARVEIVPEAASRLVLTARLQETVSRFPTNSNGVVVDRNQFTYDDGVALALEGSRTLAPGVEGRLLLRAAWAERGFENEPDSPADTVGFGFRSVRQGNALRRGGDARVVWSGAQGSLSTGLDWEIERERLLSRSESNFGGGRSISADGVRGDRWTMAGYAQGVWVGPVGSRWTVGVRADENEVFGTFLTGQAGLVLPLPARLGRIRGSAGSAFKAPTFSHQFAASPFEVGNPDLKPESSRSVELGWDAGLLSNRLVVGGGVFRQRFSDLIQYASRGPGLPTYWNEDRASSRGVEALVHWRTESGWTAGVEGSWIDARLGTVNGEPVAPGTEPRLLRRPARNLTGHLRGPLMVAGARGGITLNQVGSRVDQDFRSWPAERVTLPGYVTADLDLQVPVRIRQDAPPALLTLRVENALDEAFETIVGFPGNGRTVLLGIRWNP